MSYDFKIYRLCRDEKTKRRIGQTDRLYGFGNTVLYCGIDYYEFLDEIIRTCVSDYAFVCHDDVSFPLNIKDRINDCIKDMDGLFGSQNWGVAGNAGMDAFEYENIRFIKDPHSGVIPNYSKPVPVVWIDGNTLLLNIKNLRKNKVKMPKTLSGFHLYDFILLVESYKKGLVCAVTPTLFVVHKSPGDQKSFDEAKDGPEFQTYWKKNFFNHQIKAINRHINILGPNLDYLKQKTVYRKDFYSLVNNVINSCLTKQKRKLHIIIRTKLARNKKLERLLDTIRMAKITSAKTLDIDISLSINNSPLAREEQEKVKKEIEDNNKDLKIIFVDNPDSDQGQYPRVASIKRALKNIQEEQGCYIWIVDDDDFIFPNYLKDITSFLDEKSVLVGKVLAFEEIWDNNQAFPSSSREKNKRYDTHLAFRNMLGENYIPISAAIYPLTLLKEVFTEFELLGDYFEDYAINLIAMSKADMRFFPFPISGISLHGQNTILASDRTHWDFSLATFLSEIINKKLVKKWEFDFGSAFIEQEKEIWRMEAELIIWRRLNSLSKNLLFRTLVKARKIRQLSVIFNIAKSKVAIALKRDGILRLPLSLYKHLKRTKGRIWRFPLIQGHRDYVNQGENSIDINRIDDEIRTFSYKPKISILMPVYNVDPKYLNECVKSVINQIYTNWELCINDDASSNKKTLECLKKWTEKRDSRIKILFSEENGHISESSNKALRLATGEFIALLDNDDTLAPDALFEVVKLLNEYPETDMIYTDEDTIDAAGRRAGPYFKPDWSYDLFLSVMYTCHLGVYRKSLVEKIGGFRKGYEGAQDYDLVLRLISETSADKIKHISKILYHWRAVETSTAFSVRSKPYALESGKKALEDHLKRNKIKGKVATGPAPTFYRVIREIKKEEKVSIIIPFKDQVSALKRCLESIEKKTDYKNYEILLVDNASEEEKTKEYLNSLDKAQAKILSYNKPFNFSAINNFAAKKATGKYLLFLNNDTEVINSDWLRSMVEHIQREEVGAVGGFLTYPNRSIQHAGVVLESGFMPKHIYNGVYTGSNEFNSLMKVIRNYSAVTGACMLVKKKIFLELGGFDEKDFPIAYNDIDFCLKLRKKGLSIVFTPYARLIHYEGLSRGREESLIKQETERYKDFIKEKRALAKKWSSYIPSDPFYNPNL